MVRFPPPKSHDTFCPPISRFPKGESVLPRIFLLWLGKFETQATLENLSISG